MDKCLWDKKTYAHVLAAYHQSKGNIMTTAVWRTGKFGTFDEGRQEVSSGNEVFKY